MRVEYHQYEEFGERDTIEVELEETLEVRAEEFNKFREEYLELLKKYTYSNKEE